MTAVATGTVKGAKRVYYARVDTDGYLVASDGTAPANGNQTGVYQQRLRGLLSAGVQPEEAQRTDARGDDGVVHTYIDEPQSLPGDEWQFGVFDFDFEALVQGTKKKNHTTNITKGAKQPSDQAFVDMAITICGQGKSADTATSAAAIWYGEDFGRLQVSPRGRDAFADNAVGQFTYSAQSNRMSRGLEGIAFDDTNDGTTEKVAEPWTAYGPLRAVRWNGDGTETVFNLPSTPYSESGDDIVVTVNGTKQTITTGFVVSASAKTITFQAGSIPADGAKIQCQYAELV